MKLLNKFIFIVVSISVFFSPITYGITAEEILAEGEEKLRQERRIGYTDALEEALGLVRIEKKEYEKLKEDSDTLNGALFLFIVSVFAIVIIKIKHKKESKELNSTINSYKFFLTDEEKKRKILEILLLEEQNKTKFLENLLQKPKNEIELIAYKTFLDTRERETTFGNFKIY